MLPALLQFQNFSIRSKLTTLFLLMGGIVLLVSEVFFISHELRRLHEDLKNQLTPVAQILAFQSQAALTFGDQESAHALLSSVKGHSSIVAAYFYDSEGEVFATYKKHPKLQTNHQAIAYQLIKEKPLGPHFTFLQGEAHILNPVQMEGEFKGRIHLVDDLSSFEKTVTEFMLLSLLVIVANLILAFLIAAQLPKIIANPILSLKQLMVRVSKNGEYHLRAYKHHNDELGELVDGVNAMLDEVEKRDRALAGYSERLEQDVARRTQQLHRSMRALETERDRAESANRAKSAFLAAMSHEIRTPMNGVLGMLSLLRNTHLGSQQQRYVHMAHHSSETLLAIINDILDFSKIEAGQLNLEIIPFNLRNVLEEISHLFEEPVKTKGLNLRCEIDPNVAPAYRGDPTRLRQVLFNLLGNAIKFTEQGDIYIIVKVLDENYLNFRVEDSGIGIPKEKQLHIFEAFAQADHSTTRKYGGTGLGLAICQQLIKIMGGEIGVQSKLGEGATFWFTLPMPLASLEEQHELQKHAETNIKTLSSSNKDLTYHILLAEDNPVNQEVAKAELETLGCHVSIAKNGREAFELYQKNMFDLILMDCEMPELDGFQATEVIRRYEKQRLGKSHIPIIALTANAIVGTKEACIQAGMDGYLSKPFTQEQLLDTLRPWLKTEMQTPQLLDESQSITVALEPNKKNMLDQNKIDKLRELQPNMLQRIANLYLQHSSEQMQQLDTAVIEQNVENIARIGHSLKSGSLNVGAEAFSKLCKAIELQSKHGTMPNVESFNELKATYQATVEALKQEIAG